LQDLVARLSGSGAGGVPTGGTGGPLGGTGGGSLFDQISKMTAGGGTAGAGTGAKGPDVKMLGDAMIKHGLSGVGRFPMDAMQQADLDAWVKALEQGGSSWDDPRIMEIMKVADQAGYNTNEYAAWAQRQPKEGAQWFQAGQPAPPAIPGQNAATAMSSALPAGGAQQPAATAGLNAQDSTMLAGISSVMAGGLDPFMLQKLDPTQRDMLLSGAARLGYHVPTELWRSETRRPGQGDPLAA
jgi:hypothetical protein